MSNDDSISDASLSPSRSREDDDQEEEGEGEDGAEAAEGDEEEEEEEEEEEDDDAEEDEDEDEGAEDENRLQTVAESASEKRYPAAMGMKSPVLRPNQKERLQFGLQQHSNLANEDEDELDEDNDDVDDEDDDEDDDGYSHRGEENLTRGEFSDHHMHMNEHYDPSESLPLDDLVMEKGDHGPSGGDLLKGKEIEGTSDCLSFLKRPPEEDDGTPEEQIEFVRELEKFFAERKMEYRHPKFYRENLNCLKLWRAVIRLGGYEAVTAGKLWRQVGDTFKPPKSCTTVSWSFHGFYKKALLDYERYKMHGVLPSQSASHSDTGEAQSDALQSSFSKPSTSSLGRARRDAASRAMQGWHSQKFIGNGDVGDAIMKEKGHNSSAKRSKQPKISLLKKRASNPERSVHNKGTKPPFIGSSVQKKDDNWKEKNNPSHISLQKRKPMKQHPHHAWKGGDDIWVTDDGPQADWVKINVHKAQDCFEIYALIPGLVRDEVRIQCEPGGQLIISGEPEESNSPWGVTSFRKIINLPLPIDATQTSAIVTLHGQLFVRVPYDQSPYPKAS